MRIGPSLGVALTIIDLFIIFIFLMNALIWNVKEANKKGLIAHIRYVSAQNNVGFCAILEPRISGNKTISVAKKLGFCGIFQKHAMGFSEGIWIL